MAETFSKIYRQNLWQDAESRSGPGSTRERGADFIDDLVALLRSIDCKVLLDAPCGDFNWISPAAAAVDRYIGVDIVPELVAGLHKEYGDAARQFLTADLTRARLPTADVILCRDGLVHFSFDDIQRAIENFKRSGSRYLLSTTFIARGANEDIQTGAWRPLALEAPPFNFPPPTAMVDERCRHSGGQYRDKRLALWPLASLPNLALTSDMEAP